MGSYPVLFMVFMIQSVGWSFFPVLMTIPFELRGIKPREVAIVTSSIYTVVGVGAFAGPILTGAIQEWTGSLRVGLMITCAAPASLILTGLLLSKEWDRAPDSR